MKKIIHIDMDAFFASVEQRDQPHLKGKPIAVGGGGARGVVAAASYEARKFGVRSAMPSVTAKRLCPELIFVRHRFDAYRSVSHQIREIFYEYTDLVEPLSLDEAFLDVTRNHLNKTSATLIAKEIIAKIKDKTQLTASAGISVNKFLAKVASDMNKPNGITLIAPEHIEDFIAELKIDDFFGVGKVTAEKMKNLGIYTGADLQRYTRPELVRLFGKAGAYYYHICRGEDSREVKSDRKMKSISVENTFKENTKSKAELEYKLPEILDELTSRIEKKKVKGKTLTMKIKNDEFQNHTRSISKSDFFNDYATIKSLSEQLIDKLPLDKEIRLLGLSLSNLNVKYEEKTGQLTLKF